MISRVLDFFKIGTFSITTWNKHQYKECFGKNLMFICFTSSRTVILSYKSNEEITKLQAKLVQNKYRKFAK